MSLPIFDRASLLDRVDGDDALLGAIVEVFLDDAPHGLRALDRALERMDLEALHAAAHALESAAASISAEVLRATAHALEYLASGGQRRDAAAGVAEVRAAFAALKPVLERSLHDGPFKMAGNEGSALVDALCTLRHDPPGGAGRSDP